MDPIFRRDRRAVAELLSEDFREFGSSGRIWTKDSILEMLTSEEAFTTPTVEDFQTQQLSPDTYLVTYRTSRPNQDAPPSAALRSSIWTNRSDKWEILFHQGTRKNIRSAVDWFVLDMPGRFLPEMVLRIVHSAVAMQRCYEIFQTESNRSRANSAVFLLRQIADSRVLPWVREFLSDENETIRFNGVDVLRWLLYDHLRDPEISVIKELLDIAELDSSSEVRRRAHEVRLQLARYELS